MGSRNGDIIVGLRARDWEIAGLDVGGDEDLAALRKQAVKLLLVGGGPELVGNLVDLPLAGAGGDGRALDGGLDVLVEGGGGAGGGGLGEEVGGLVGGVGIEGLHIGDGGRFDGRVDGRVAGGGEGGRGRVRRVRGGVLRQPLGGGGGLGVGEVDVRQGRELWRGREGARE